MKLKFWGKEIEKEEIKIIPPVGSFLFATGDNVMKIISIERLTKTTEILFMEYRGESIQVRTPYRYSLTINQHEDFVNQISKKIECIVTTGK